MGSLCGLSHIDVGKVLVIYATGDGREGGGGGQTLIMINFSKDKGGRADNGRQAMFLSSNVSEQN